MSGVSCIFSLPAIGQEGKTSHGLVYCPHEQIFQNSSNNSGCEALIVSNQNFSGKSKNSKFGFAVNFTARGIELVSINFQKHHKHMNIRTSEH